MAKQKTFYLIDGHSQIFRAYYARASFRNRSQAMGAVFIFTRMLLKLLSRGKPDAIVCAFDSKGVGGVRTEMFPEYKANRDPMPEDLAEVMPEFHRVVEGMSIPGIEGGEYEADDVIGTLAKEAEKAGYQVRIVSRDKDLKQLLSENVYLYDADDGSLYGPEELEMDTGLRPEQFIDLLALMGDTVDNIPGVPGVGPKKAQKLLQEYGSIESVLERAEEIKQPKMRENLIAFREQAPLSKKLATVICDMDLDFELEEASANEPEREKFEPILRDLGFNSILKDLGWELADSDAPSTAKSETSTSTPASKKKASRKKASAPAGPDLFSAAENAAAVSETTEIQSDPKIGEYHLITTKKDLKSLVSSLKKAKRFAVDTETTGVEALEADLVGLSFAWKEGEGVYVPVKAPEGTKTLDLESVVEALKPVLEDPKLGKIGQNIKYDMLVLRRHGIHLRGVVFDTQIAAYLANNQRQQISLDQLAQELLDYRCIPITALIGTDKKTQKTMDQIDLDRVSTYAAEDADITLRASTLLQGELDEFGLDKLNKELESPLVEVLADMESTGIAIDLPYLESVKEDFEKRIHNLEKACHKAAGREFTINSPKQLAEVLFDEIGLEAQGKTAKGKRSTAVEVLESLADQHELPQLVLDYRHLSKLLSTYVIALPQLADEEGRVHTSFRQAVATGRLASTNPNVQNIPVRTEEGKKLRRAFIAGSGDLRLVAADYSQIELRILAHLSGDPGLQRAFQEERDIHRAVAAEVNGVEEDQVTPEMRSNAKAIHFGIIYGQSAFGLSQALGIPRSDASSFIANYFERFPKVREFIDEVHEQAKKEGYSSTILGRRRYISGLQDRNKARQAAALRQAFNTVVQGSAADLIKQAMVKIHRRIREEGLPYKLLIQVHDELLLEVPKKESEAAASFLIQEMENALDFDVPIKVDAGTGSNWLEAK